MELISRERREELIFKQPGEVRKLELRDHYEIDVSRARRLLVRCVRRHWTCRDEGFAARLRRGVTKEEFGVRSGSSSSHC
jgi:hypothetical protein